MIYVFPKRRQLKWEIGSDFWLLRDSFKMQNIDLQIYGKFYTKKYGDERSEILDPKFGISFDLRPKNIG